MDKEFKKRYIIKLGLRLACAAAAGIILFVALKSYGLGWLVSSAAGAAAFFVASLALKVHELLAPGFDGVVTSKTVRYVTTQNKQNVPEYELVVTDPRCREHKDIFLDKEDEGKLNRIEYYDHGERVRKHRGFKYFEKFDKSGKNSVVCINCGTLNPSMRERCINCGLPLLRESIKE